MSLPALSSALRRAAVPFMAPRAALYSTTLMRATGAGLPQKKNLFEPDEVDHQQESREKYFGKYAHKINKAMEQEKVSSVAELKKKKEQVTGKPVESTPKPSEAAAPAAAEGSPAAVEDAKAKAPKPNSKRGAQLSDILKVENIEDIPPELLVKMWTFHHSNKEAYVSGSLTADAYRVFRERTKAYKHFVIPIQRSEGYETFMMEAIAHQVAFVSLIEFKLHRENAQPCLVLDFFGELLEKKGVSLFRGLVEEKKISREEGAKLANLLFEFYTASEEGFQLIEQFHKQPASFDVNKLIALVDKTSPHLPV